ncbi:uncharacterized protein LOC121381652 [Gigantopelta aegis]|uniref:uncharacterized protein LOC121381652 n=1 Tax=Gigantopelta aegis TaxID=1735272 RepID=UPI001B88BEE4|nr:uncharacterized protein LOC121381652 [Gigantopelta aegis]
MDREIQECLLYLQQNASEVRELGKGWGMTDAEINQCVAKAMRAKVDTTDQLSSDNIAAKFKTRKSWNRVRCFAKYTILLTGLVLVAAASGAAVLWCQGKPLFMMTPDRLLQPYAYQIMKVVRIFGPPFQALNPMIRDYYTEECIVKNPLWVDWDIDCEVCKLATKVTEFKNPRKELDIDTFRIPAVFKNLMPRGVTLEDVTSVILHSKVDLSRPIQSTADWSGTAVDFANNATVDKIAKSHGFQFHWKSDFNLEVGRLMRTLFPRPLVFEKELEVSVKKYLYVDGPNSEGYSLPDWEVGFAWYTQGFGVRTVTFTPVQQCTDQCSSFQMNVAQRDVLIYPVGYWVVSVLSNGEDLSISYMGEGTMKSSLCFITDRVAEIRKMGKAGGLDEGEIDSCASEVFVEDQLDLWKMLKAWDSKKTTRNEWILFGALLCLVIFSAVEKKGGAEVIIQLFPPVFASHVRFAMLSYCRKISALLLKHCERLGSTCSSHLITLLLRDSGPACIELVSQSISFVLVCITNIARAVISIMEAVARSKDFLTKQVAELRKLGEVWGLDQEEIDVCSYDVCTDRWTELWTSCKAWMYKMATRRHLVYLGVAMLPVLLLVLLNTPAVNVAIEILPPHMSAGVFYAFMSSYRKMVAHILPFVDLTDNYNAQCMVNNPLWEDPMTSDCHVCDGLKQVKQFKTPIKSMKPFLFGYVLVHRQHMPKNVTIEELSSLIDRNRNTVSNRTKSSVPWIKTTLDLAVDDLEEKINGEKNFHLVWNSQNQLFDGQLMRKLFPRPKFFPPEVESSIVKDIMIDGPHSSEYPLHEGQPGEYGWYAQGKGTKTLLFTPLGHCQDKCYSFQITMNQGDLLTYPVGGWHVKSLVNGKDISISYVSHLSFLS